MMTDEAIGRIMDRFDFALVCETMEHHGWKWDMDGQLRFPTEGEMRATAQWLLMEVAVCWEELQSTCVRRAGGFVASCDGRGILRLDFVLESWDSEYGITEDD